MTPYVINPVLLKKERIKKGYTQKAFADLIGISNVRLCNIEKAPNCAVSIKTANKIIKELNCEWSDIFGFTEK